MRLAIACASCLWAGCSLVVPGSGAYDFGRGDAGMDAGAARDGGLDADTHRDAGPDGGLDADTTRDAAPDAGDADPCVEPCTDPTPYCRWDGQCVACLSGADCGTGAPFCDNEGVCVECLQPTTGCNALDRPQCTNGLCVLCTNDFPCTRFTSTPACNGGRCAECSPTNRTACAGLACRPDGTCSAYAAGTLGVCETCDTDANCQPGQLCVPMTFETTAVGSYCLWRQDAAGGPAGSCSSVPPYARADTITSIDSVSANVCALRATTCEALRHRDVACARGLTSPPDGDAECGLAGIDDGLCRGADTTVSTCTIRCQAPDDCPAGSTCRLELTPSYCGL